MDDPNEYFHFWGVSTDDDPDEMIMVTRELYDDLCQKEAWLDALEAGGVDNWEGYRLAQDIFDAFNKSD